MIQSVMTCRLVDSDVRPHKAQDDGAAKKKQQRRAPAADTAPSRCGSPTAFVVALVARVARPARPVSCRSCGSCRSSKTAVSAGGRRGCRAPQRRWPTTRGKTRKRECRRMALRRKKPTLPSVERELAGLSLEREAGTIRGGPVCRAARL
jgi:hypothetical protein